MTKVEEFAAALTTLTVRQQHNREIVIAICNHIRDATILRLTAFPPHWDGHQMREWLYEKFSSERTAIMTERNSYPRRQFNAEKFKVNP